MNKTGVIYGINGPVVYLKGNTGFKMSEMVYVGKERLVGEVIALTKDTGFRGNHRTETRRNSYRIRRCPLCYIGTWNPEQHF